jgi:ribonucleoside-diphosphate reductase alpha chain
MPTPAGFAAPIAEEIWNLKYRLRDGAGQPLDADLDATFHRVAAAAAAAEKGGRRVRERWARRFHEAIADMGFLPGGRILAGAGAKRAVTLFNCFVMGRIEDDLSSIFEHVKEAALTMQQGGGIGHDFSTLRPKGAPVRSIGADASGPVSFMDVWDAMCRTIMSAGARRGAMMATLRCDHPDIETFIDAKRDPARLRNFNLSVLVTDAFLAAVAADAPWDLVFDGKVHRTVPARALWERLMRATYEVAEPGVIFIDRINAENNLAYCEQIRSTNPCGEQPLPPYGACLLGSINLAQLVEHPFSAEAAIDTARLEQRVAVAVRFLDDVIDVSGYPLERQRQEAKAKRRLGLGVTGLADALILAGAHYGSPRGRELAASWMRSIQRAAYLASAELAREKGAFALFDADRFLAGPNVARLDAEVAKAIRRNGIRNGCLTSIAPTGTISLLAGNVSSGIEPVFDYLYVRRVLAADGSRHEQTVEDFAHALFRRRHGGAALPETFVRAEQLAPRAHLEMQAALQPWVDSAISKTINCPESMPFEAFADVYLEAYRMGLKGCTTYRPNPVTGAVLAPIVAEGGPPPAGDRTGSDGAGSAGRGRIAPQPPPAVEAVPTPNRAGDVVYMARPLERDGVLSGYTYKLKWPASDHAIYVTINDIERDGRRRPFEIFINTRNLEHYAWTVALTRMISAVFRRGGDVTFVAEELKAVFDPQGGQWMGGRYVPSLLAAIGEVIETHMVRTGFLQAGAEPLRLGEAVEPPRLALPAGAERPEAAGGRTERPPGKLCPRCSSADYLRQEGCWVCRACGYSRCV